MWNWIKDHCQVVDLAVSAVAGVASLAIAFFAFQIDRMMQENAIKEGRISRSVALAQGIVSDPAVMRLLTAAGTIEIATDRRFQERLDDANGSPDGVDIGDMYKEAQIATLIEFNNNNDSFKTDLAVLLQHIRRAAVCVTKGLCDSETAIALSGHVLHDIYYMVRPALACDTFLKRTPPTYYYSIIKMHLEQEANNNNVKIFLDQEELEAAGELAAEAPYQVLAFGPDSFCNMYRDVVEERPSGAMAGR